MFGLLVFIDMRFSIRTAFRDTRKKLSESSTQSDSFRTCHTLRIPI